VEAPWQARGGNTGKRVGSKVNDKDANLANCWNTLVSEKQSFTQDLKPVRAQIFIPPAIY
jgi:hypothetical protein